MQAMGSSFLQMAYKASSNKCGHCARCWRGELVLAGVLHEFLIQNG